MSARDDRFGAAADGAEAEPVLRPPGLLEKLVAAVRPEFRADDLIFDPRDPVFGGPPCEVSGCARPARNRGMCLAHRQRWAKEGKPGPAAFTAATGPVTTPGPGAGEHIDLRSLPAQLRLEMQYVLQCRHQEQKAKLVPGKVQRIVRALADAGVASLLDQPEEFWEHFGAPGGVRRGGWRAFTLDAYHRVEALAAGCGWDVEYPRDTWRLRNVGITAADATIRFGQIPQPWLKDLTKRWARMRLTGGSGTKPVCEGVRAVSRFAAFLASRAGTADQLAQIDRPLLERYLADLHAELAGRESHIQHVVGLNAVLRAIRQHGWDDTLPAGAALFPEDYPKRAKKLPRPVAEHVMTQLERAGNLDRWGNPAYRLITLILMRCGLRVSDATRLPSDCVVRDRDGAPYLRYYNHKMKREALVPIDEDLQAEIEGQQQRVLQRWAGGAPVLFPRPHSNLDGHQPVKSSTYRGALHRWLARCDIRDEQGQPARLVPHQWRHVVGTRLINRDVPQHVVQKILDHDSAEMTAHYARLSDTTVRRHWEAARKVNAEGETVTIDPGGPLAEAAWIKQGISRATQALPNGYCGLPIQQSCPHANACLAPCPVFLTTPEFLPQHRRHRSELLQVISAAEARGHSRVAEMNQGVLTRLGKIITSLEADEDPSGQQAAADAC